MLTTREELILSLSAVGLSTKEVADKLHRSPETVRKTISNIKEKVGLQKNTELTAYFFCQKHGENFYDVRKRILAVVMLLCFLYFETGLGLGDMFPRNVRLTRRIEMRCSRRKIEL